MARLPIPGGDNFKWGKILNKYLLEQHNDDGSHDLQKILNIPINDDFVLVSKHADQQKVAWRQLDKNTIGLGEVNNTSDLDKPVSSATQAALSDRIAKSGDKMTGNLVIDGHQDNSTKSLELTSALSSDDVAGGTDGTSRLNLQSYQRANYNTFGETIRHFLMKKNAKAMEAYYVPKQGYNTNGDPIADINSDGTIADTSQWQPVSWTGSHFQANNGASNHVHWELEIPDSTGALQGRLEVPFADPNTEQIGLDKTFIRTNLADLVIRTSNNQMLRLASPAGNHKPIEFNHDSEGLTEFRRWVIRANSTAESGSDAGTDFQIVRYNDSGGFQDSPLFIRRSSGYIGLGTISTPARISLTSSTSSDGGINFGGDTNLYRSASDTLKTDDKFDANSFSVGGLNGTSGNFISNDGKSITVTNGIITNIA